jgi:hypothetical protein
MLPFDFPLIKEAKIQYYNLLIAELVVIPLGIGLWLLGRRLRRADKWPKRATGVVVLALAVLYTLGWLVINVLVLGTGLGLL